MTMTSDDDYIRIILPIPVRISPFPTFSYVYPLENFH